MTKNSSTYLFDVFKGNDLNKVLKVLEDKDFDVNSNIKTCYENSTPLNIALTYGQSFSIVVALIKHGADVNAKDYYGRCPLFCSVISRHIYRYNIIMMNIKLNMFNYLLECGANANVKYNSGYTLLHDFVMQPRLMPGVIESLLKYGAYVDARDKDEQTPLHYDSSRKIGQTLTKILLKYDANVNARDNKGETPLHKYIHFLCHGWYKTIYMSKIKLMLDYGADVNIKNNEGETVLLCSVKPYHGDRKSINVIKLLLEHGADINAKNNNGENILHAAVKNERIDIIRFLLKYNKMISTSNITE